MTSIRGLVISPPITIWDKSFRLDNTGLDPQQLRANQLYWDKVDFPDSNIIHIEEDDDAKYLMDCGIMQRTQSMVQSSGDMAQLYLDTHLNTFRILDRNEPGVWSLATGDKAISFPEGLITPAQGALVSLVNAIPVPDIEVPYDEILEFKENRRTELLALRNELEFINQMVIRSEESSESVRKAIDRISQAAADNLSVSQESSIKWRWSSITAKLNVFGGILGGAAGELVGQRIGLIGLGGIIGGLIPGIRIDIGGSLSWTKPTATPYQYVSTFHREVFGGR